MDQNIYVSLKFNYKKIDDLMKTSNSSILKPVKSLDDLKEGTIIITPISKTTYHITRVGKPYGSVEPLEELAKYTEDGKAPNGFRAFNEGRIILYENSKPELIVGLDDIRRWADEQALYEHKIVLDKDLQTNINSIYSAAKLKHAELGKRFALIINKK